ncbi:MAG: small basic protein [Verrucomicrobiales bacterium]
MSQHASLRKSSSIGATRSVLKRFERIKLLQKRGEWEKGKSPLGLPKTTPEA